MSDKTSPKDRAVIRAWERAHPESVVLSKKKWADANRERVREKNRLWQQRNKIKSRAAVHRHRAKRHGVPGDYSAADWLVLCWASGWRCHYCGNGPLSETAPRSSELRAECDHKTPMHRGGPNSIDNLVLACSPCNLRKGRKTYERFMQIMAEEEKAIESLRAEEE